MVSYGPSKDELACPQNVKRLSSIFASKDQINMILTLLESEPITKKGFQRKCGIKEPKNVGNNIKRFLGAGILEEIMYEDSNEKYYRINWSENSAKLITIIKEINKTLLSEAPPQDIESLASILGSRGKIKMVKVCMEYDELSLSSLRKKCGLSGRNARSYINSFLKAGIFEEIVHGTAQKFYRIKRWTERSSKLVSYIEAMYSAPSSPAGRKEEDHGSP